MSASWEEIQEEAKVLVVDDDLSNLRLIGRIFGNAGYRNVELVSDPRTVQSLVAGDEPDLILLDVTMPYKNGFEVLEEIREVVAADTYLPVIILTAAVEDTVMLRALVAGAKDFQTKPLDFVELMLRVRVHLETRFQVLDLQREVARLRALQGE